MDSNVLRSLASQIYTSLSITNLTISQYENPSRFSQLILVISTWAHTFVSLLDGVINVSSSKISGERVNKGLCIFH